QSVWLRSGRVALRLGPVHQGPALGLRQGDRARHLRDQEQGRHHGLDPRISEGRPLAVNQLPPALSQLQDEIKSYADEFGLDTFPVVFETVDYRHMCEIAAYGGFPVRYPHWRFGMEYDHMLKSHTYGLSKIYEL